MLYKKAIWVSLLFIGASMSACGPLKWDEDVQLSDGTVIAVERELIREAGGGEWVTNRSGTKPKEYRIRFEYPKGSGQMNEWHSIKISPQTWPEVPLIIDIESGHAVIYTIVANSEGCEVYSKYMNQNGSWIEKSLPVQFEQRITNLLYGTKEDLPSHVFLGDQARRNSGAGYRKSLKQVGPSRKVCG